MPVLADLTHEDDDDDDARTPRRGRSSAACDAHSMPTAVRDAPPELLEKLRVVIDMPNALRTLPLDARPFVASARPIGAKPHAPALPSLAGDTDRSPTSGTLIMRPRPVVGDSAPALSVTSRPTIPADHAGTPAPRRPRSGARRRAVSFVLLATLAATTTVVSYEIAVLTYDAALAAFARGIVLP